MNYYDVSLQMHLLELAFDLGLLALIAKLVLLKLRQIHLLTDQLETETNKLKKD